MDRYRREIGPLRENSVSGRSSISGPSARGTESYVGRTRYDVTGASTYGRATTATSLRSTDLRARSSAYVDRSSAGRTASTSALAAGSRSRTSGSTLYWGTTAVGSRSVVGTYLRVPLSGGGGAAPYYHHDTYHSGGRHGAYVGYNIGHFGYYPYGFYLYGRYPSYWGGYSYYNRPYYHSGLYVGLGWNYGWGYYGYRSGWSLGIYDPWPYHVYYPYYWRYPRYSYTGDYYRPYYYGETVVNNYYYYGDDDPAPVVVDGSSTDGDAPVVERTVSAPAPSGTAPAAPAPGADDEAFLQGLNPPELAFVTGLVSFRGGEYEQASQAWYNATLKSPEALAPRMFLVTGLFAVGEYQRAAEYLRDTAKRTPDIAAYRWDARRLYGKTNATAFDRQMKTLDSYIELYPNQADGYLVRGFMLTGAGDVQGAARAFELARTIDRNDVAAQVFVKALTEQPKTMFDEYQTFLNTLRLEDVKTLKL